MAATKRNAMLHAEARLKIKTTQLINRLQNHALGTLNLEPTQIQATKILLDKVLPNLAQQQIAGDDKNPVVHEVRVTFVGS